VVKGEVMKDSESLIGASCRGHKLRFWDEGFGDLWVYIESLGPVGVVRARTWEEAYECVTDEIMCDADEDFLKECLDEMTPEERDNGDLPEGFIYRGGTPANEDLSSSIASEDLNGSSLLRMTDAVAEQYSIEVEVEEEM